MLVCAQGGLDPGNAIEVAGPTAAALALAVLAPAAAFAAWSLRDRAVTIYGGTNEVQLNIISKRVLGLPD